MLTGQAPTAAAGSGRTALVLVDVINDWVKFGHGRHGRMCTPAQLAHGVVAAVSLSRGAYVRELEIQPEAPIES